LAKITERVYPFALIAVFFLFILLFLSVVRTSIFGAVSEDKHLFFEITLLLLIAVLAELAFSYVKQPTVIILLVLGILMSKSVLGFDIIRDQHLLEIFAQLGAIFLLFRVGLHSHLTKVFSKENLVVAAFGVIVPFIIGYYYASFSGGSFAYSMFLGAALTATSVGVTVAILKELKVLEKKFSEVIIGAAVIDDILGLLVLAFVINAPNGITGEAIVPMLGVAATAAIFLAGGVIAGKAFVREILDKLPSDNKNFLLSLSFLFIYAYIAEYIGLSSIIGAFLAGMILNYSRHVKELEDKIYALDVIFVPIFFISLGMLVDVSVLSAIAIPALIITVIAILSKVVGCGLGAVASKIPKYDSLLIGVGMSPRGEVALIVALIGLTKGALTSGEYALISAMALLTTLFAPPVLNWMIKRMKQ
jgi:Kef-type K+ transport system membrane component KefB